MNQFEASTLRAIKKHGKLSIYKSITVGTYDPAISKVVNTEVSKSVYIYKKSIKANQYYYPNLIGKEISMFYVLASDISEPKIGDHIVFDSKTFKVDSYQSHSANGSVILHRILGVI